MLKNAVICIRQFGKMVTQYQISLQIWGAVKTTINDIFEKCLKLQCEVDIQIGSTLLITSV